MMSCSTFGCCMFSVFPQPVKSCSIAGRRARGGSSSRCRCPRPRERRPHLVPLGGVVVHHVEDHFDSDRVQVRTMLLNSCTAFNRVFGDS